MANPLKPKDPEGVLTIRMPNRLSEKKAIELSNQVDDALKNGYRSVFLHLEDLKLISAPEKLFLVNSMSSAIRNDKLLIPYGYQFTEYQPKEKTLDMLLFKGSEHNVHYSDNRKAAIDYFKSYYR